MSEKGRRVRPVLGWFFSFRTIIHSKDRLESIEIDLCIFLHGYIGLWLVYFRADFEVYILSNWLASDWGYFLYHPPIDVNVYLLREVNIPSAFATSQASAFL